MPVPEVLEVRRDDPATGAPGLLVTSYVPGERVDLLLPTLERDALASLGWALGRLAGVLACMPMPRAGPFVDAALTLGDFGADSDLLGVLENHVERLEGWSGDELRGLRAVAERATDILAVVRRRSLVHSDLNPKNVLVDPHTLRPTALLDWEFAHAGHPASDLGNLLRFDREPAYVEAVLAGYRDRVPAAEGGEDLLDRARAADLVALITLAVRRGENPVADRAHDRLRTIARTLDLHAGG